MCPFAMSPRTIRSAARSAPPSAGRNVGVNRQIFMDCILALNGD